MKQSQRAKAKQVPKPAPKPPAKPAPVPTLISTTIARPSEAARRMAEDLNLISDLRGGTKAMRKAAGRYLPRSIGEEPERFQNRLQRSVMFDAFNLTLRQL